MSRHSCIKISAHNICKWCEMLGRNPDCKKSFNNYFRHGTVRIICVLISQGVVGNEKANNKANGAREFQNEH